MSIWWKDRQQLTRIESRSRPAQRVLTDFQQKYQVISMGKDYIFNILTGTIRYSYAPLA